MKKQESWLLSLTLKMKKKHITEQVRYYKSETDDFVHSKNQSYRLPDDYVWLDERTGRKLFSAVLYALARIYAFFYVRLLRRIKIKNKELLKQCKNTGMFLYGNHTQPVGDVFIPVYICGRKRIYTIAGQENLGLPGIGRLLPCLGALPVPDTLSQTKRFLEAVQKRIEENCCVTVYPESHVWPYCTKIRSFAPASFYFPVKYKAPSFCMTVTYQKRIFRKIPGITIYIDGPFYPDLKGSQKKAQKKLHDEIFNCMQSRSACSSYEYIRYREEKNP